MKTEVLFLLFLVILMITASKGLRRFVWLMIGFFFLNDTIAIQPFNSYTLFCTAFFFSLILHGEFKSNWKGFPFKAVIIVLLIIHILVVQFDERPFPPLTYISRVFNNFVPRFFALFVGYAAASSIKVWKKGAKPMALIFTIMCIYGFVTYVLQNNPYDDVVHMAFGNELGIWHDVQSRGYRVFSTLNTPNVYGFVMFMAATYLYLQRRLLTKKSYLIVTLLVVFNIFLANSRTCMIAGMLMIVFYILIEYKISYKLIGYSFFLLVFLVLLYDLPFVKPVVDGVTDIFVTGGEASGGSTTDLREDQLATSLFFFYKHPYFGNGFNYFQEVIGARYDTYEIGLAGLEGYGYKLLVEEGAFMIIAVVWLFVSMIVFFFCHKVHECSSMGFAWTLSFLVYMLSTGSYGGIYTIGMLLIGMLLRYVQDTYALVELPHLKRSKNSSSLIRR